MKRIYQQKVSPSTTQRTRTTNREVAPHVDAASIQRAIENPTPETLTPDVIAAIQQLHGNQAAVQLARQTERYPIQAKLTVTEANDHYEQEADQVAKQVVAQLQRTSLQREPEEELQMKRDTVQREPEEEELQMKRDAVQREPEEEELQMKRADDPMGGVQVSDDIEAQIQAERGGGKSLPNNLQAGMGQAMGADFSGVRVHTDSTADHLARSVQAKAFTTGSDIFFRSGTYNPSSSAGQELLAHELTHTIQQGAAQRVSKAEKED